MLYASTLPTPAGPLSLIADGDVVVAGGFTPDPDELYGRLGSTRRHLPMRTRSGLGDLTRAATAYFEGDLAAWDGLQTDQDGTAYQRRVWAALRDVPPGMTITYTELAGCVGSPGTARAAGSACARNLVAPLIPCHRIVRTDGTLGGYYYGLHVKRWLLDHEAFGTRSTTSDA